MSKPIAKPLVQLPAGSHRVAGRHAAQPLAAGSVQHDPSVVAAQATGTNPGHLAKSAELVQQAWHVARDSSRQDVAFENRGRNRHARQLVDHLRQSLDRRLAPDRGRRLADRPDALPGRQEPRQHDLIDRLHFPPKPGQRSAPQLAQHIGIAPLPRHAARPELAEQDRPRFQ